MGLQQWLLGTATNEIHQAQQQLQQADTPAWTPTPLQDDWGAVTHPTLSRSFHNLPEPDAEEIEWLYNRSDEWSSVVIRLRNEVWRRGLDIVSTHQKFCVHCGTGTDDPDRGCPDELCDGHDHPDRLVDPDPKGREVLRHFLENANKTEREDLREVGSKKTEEMLKHGRGYVIYHKHYQLEDEGDTKGKIVEASLEQVHAASTARLVKIREHDTGKPGGVYICLACRSRDDYEPQDTRGHCPTCNGVLYEAWYAERRFAKARGTSVAGSGGTGLNWYLPSEVHETKWPYRDGSPPVARLMPKIATLLLMDWYGAWALDLKRDKKPDKVLVTIGGDEGAVRRWAKRDAEERKRNPYKMSHLHLPHPAQGLQELKMDAKVLDLGEQEFKGQMIELREKHETRIRKQYHVTPMQGGEVEGAGGLNNEGQQMRSQAQVAEDIQNHEAKWVRRVAEALGVDQWTYEFPAALEEDEGREAGVLSGQLDVAIKAAKAGLSVRWEEGEAVIEDGEIDPEAVQDQQQQQPGVPAGDFNPGSDTFGDGAGLDMSQSERQAGLVAPDYQRHDPIPEPDRLKQAFKQGQVPENAVNIQNKSEAPEDSRIITGPQGGLYYVPTGGENGQDEEQPTDIGGFDESWTETDAPDDLNPANAETTITLQDAGIEGGVNQETQRIAVMEDGSRLFVKKPDHEGFASAGQHLAGRTVYEELDVPSPRASWNPETEELAVEGVDGDVLGTLSPGTDVDPDSFRDQVAASLLAGNNDLHPGQYIVQDDGSVRVIDLDQAGFGLPDPDDRLFHEAVERQAGLASAMGMDITEDDIIERMQEMAEGVDVSELEQRIASTGAPGADHAGLQIAENIKQVQEGEWP